MKFEKKIQLLREKHNLTIKELSKKIDVSPSTYRDWEMGKKISGEEAYIKLSHLFQISLDELLLSDRSQKDETIKKIKSVKITLDEIIQSILAL